MNTIYTKYADLLVNYSLRLKKGDKFLIRGTYLSEDLLNALYLAALNVGAHPELQITLNGTNRLFYENASDDQLKYISPLNKYVMDNYDAMIRVDAPFNMKELQTIDPTKKQAVSIASTELTKTFFKRAATDDLRWSLCVFPADAAAQECDFSLTEYQDFVYSACFLNEDDPTARWQKFHNDQQNIVDFLNTKSEIRYLGNDIDVTFSTAGRTWINCSGQKNMPDGEIFTGPVEDSVNGKIRFSYPGFHMGQKVEDIQLEIKDGQVVAWSAANGKELLDQVFEIPGARRFGEVAIGTNHGIKKFTKNMLFDEKIGGTIHMAIGAGIPESGAKNESAIHWDMLADMTNGGEIYADNELIYKNGKFTIQ
ncbi:MAG: aminopeptidase [Anaerohalosphaera sp.]|nr:aminopeptidase [Anaerohalosphaera sp.]